MTDWSVIFLSMAKAAKRPAREALTCPDKIGPGQSSGSAVRTIAATRQDARSAKAAARRDAILDAALDEFSAKGFASARLEDVARRAGIAFSFARCQRSRVLPPAANAAPRRKVTAAQGQPATLLTMTDWSVIFQRMAKAAKRPAKAALARPDKIGPGQTGGSAGRSGAIAATRQDARAAKTAARRDAILEAALDEFSAKGFASARLEDVAKRAGIAKGTIYLYFTDKESLFQELIRAKMVPKGTIYLYFTDKESLFQELIRAKMVPVVGSLELALATNLPLRAIVEQAVEIFVREVYGTRRKLVIRLMISEGPRFPALAEFYYREVLSRLLKALRGMLRNAHERGELAGDALVRFPMLLGAPGIIAIVWSGLFERFEPLDVRAMMRAYFDNLFGAGRAA